MPTLCTQVITLLYARMCMYVCTCMCVMDAWVHVVPMYAIYAALNGCHGKLSPSNSYLEYTDHQHTDYQQLLSTSKLPARTSRHSKKTRCVQGAA